MRGFWKLSINYAGDYEYANEKLCNSYIVHDGLLCEVCDVGPEFVEVFFNEEIVQVPIEELNFSSPKLGYVNALRQAVWVSRMPVRHWKQGVRPQNVSCSSVGKKVKIPFNSDNFFNLTTNNYPLVENCLERVINDESESVAFSRTFCFRKEGGNTVLDYKDVKVGKFSTKNNRVELSNKYGFLEEVLEECLIKI